MTRIASVLRRIKTDAAAPVMALVFAVAASSVVLLVAGSNPIQAYSDMLKHASKLETMIDILNRATPLFIAGIAAAIGFRMNLFNIGVEGQYLLAALVAAHVGGLVHLPAPLHIALILLVAMSVGAAYSGVAGVLKVTKGVHEVISTIMLNAIATSGLIVAGLQAWQAGGGLGGNVTRVGTTPIDESGRLPNLNGFVEIFTRDIGRDRELTGVLVVAIAVGVAYHVIVGRSRFGFDLRASGANPFAAHVGGIPPKRMIVTAMVLSGAVAGLVGMTEIMDGGVFPANPIQGLGFAGIAVALLGRNSAIGALVAALIFAFLDISSGILQNTGSASREIVQIMQGLIILAAVVAYQVTERARAREEAKAAATALAAVAS
ncbi:MAG: ABC transporter permease [Actinobacteria bacterium]|nr:ABC transporter permease [Actinomycetota bacterium]